MMLHPETPTRRMTGCARLNTGAHIPKGASNPKHGAARPTKSMRTIRKHDPKSALPKKPDTPHESKCARKHRGAQPDGCVKPRRGGGAHN